MDSDLSDRIARDIREIRANHGRVVRRRRPEGPNAIDIQKIVAYLENPVSAGLWRFTGTWKPQDGISKVLLEEVYKEINGKDQISIRSGKRERKIRINEEWRSALVENVCNRLTFLFSLFDYFARQESPQTEDGEEFIAEHETVQLVLDIIDIESVKTSYAAAVQYFKEEVWFPEFKPVSVLNSLMRSKNGAFILSGAPRHDQEFITIAWDGAPLYALEKFLTLIGKIDNTCLMPVFSPEEEVFSPYFDLLGMVYESLVKQEHLRPLVHKALSNFSDENFTDCVSALGLAGEDILTQIFETFFREQLTKGLTLGQLADEIQSRASSIVRKKDDSPPDLALLFVEINSAIESQNFQNSQTLELIRKILATLIETNKHMGLKIDRLGKPERKGLLFPELVNHALTELIRYRNAASHKSRIPIGPQECRRAAYSLVVLLTWWDREKRAIDWNSKADDIVRGCVVRNIKV